MRLKIKHNKALLSESLAALALRKARREGVQNSVSAIYIYKAM